LLIRLWSTIAAAWRKTTTPFDAMIARIAGLLEPVTMLWSAWTNVPRLTAWIQFFWYSSIRL
jgi:hypothetical protein